MFLDTLHITSQSNPHFKEALHLFERRTRKKTGFFLIEGFRELLRAYEAGVVIEKLFFSREHFLGNSEQGLIEGIAKTGAEVISLDKKLFEKLSYRDRPDGLLGIAKQMHSTLDSIEERLKKSDTLPFLLLAEAIEKPGNLGTMLRSSDAAGCHGVIVCDPCTDIYNPNVIRSSVGTVFTLPVVEEEKDTLFPWLREQKIKIIAATPSADLCYTQADLTGPVAIAVGTEQTGLSELWMSHADIKVRIPMCGAADSLNVATATTLLLYEVLRQREAKNNVSRD